MRRHWHAGLQGIQLVWVSSESSETIKTLYTVSSFCQKADAYIQPDCYWWSVGFCFGFVLLFADILTHGWPPTYRGHSDVLGSVFHQATVHLRELHILFLLRHRGNFHYPRFCSAYLIMYLNHAFLENE